MSEELPTSEAPSFEIRPRLNVEMEYFKEMALQETERWIEAVTRKSFKYPQDPRRSLQDGVLLCELVNVLKPGSVRRINRLPTPLAFLDNLAVFQYACRYEFRLQDVQLFDIRDLEDLSLRGVHELEEEIQQETSRRLKNVAITIFWLGKSVRHWFKGPMLDFGAFTDIIDMSHSSQASFRTPSEASFTSSGRFSTDHCNLSQSSAEQNELSYKRVANYLNSKPYCGYEDNLGNRQQPKAPGSRETGSELDEDFTKSNFSPAGICHPVEVVRTTNAAPHSNGTADVRKVDIQQQRPSTESQASKGHSLYFGRVEPKKGMQSPATALTGKPLDPLQFVRSDFNSFGTDAADAMKPTTQQTTSAKQNAKHQSTKHQSTKYQSTNHHSTPEDEDWEAKLKEWKSRRRSHTKSVRASDGEEVSETVVEDKSGAQKDKELSSAHKISADLKESSLPAETTLAKLEKEERDVLSLFDFIKAADKSSTKSKSPTTFEKSEAADGNHFLKDQKASNSLPQLTEKMVPDGDQLANDHLDLNHPVIDQAAHRDTVDRTVNQQKETNEKSCDDLEDEVFIEEELKVNSSVLKDSCKLKQHGLDMPRHSSAIPLEDEPPPLPSAPPPAPKWNTFPGSDTAFAPAEVVQYLDDDDAVNDQRQPTFSTQGPSNKQENKFDHQSKGRELLPARRGDLHRQENPEQRSVTSESLDSERHEMLMKRMQFFGIKPEDSEEYRRLMEETSVKSNRSEKLDVSSSSSLSPGPSPVHFEEGTVAVAVRPSAVSSPSSSVFSSSSSSLQKSPLFPTQEHFSKVNLRPQYESTPFAKSGLSAELSASENEFYNKLDSGTDVMSQNVDKATEEHSFNGESSRPLETSRVPRLMEPLRSCAAAEGMKIDPTERARADYLSAMKMQPKSDVEVINQQYFDLDGDLKKMEEWNKKQEQLRKDKFKRDKEELQWKHETALQEAVTVEKEKQKQEEQMLEKEISWKRQLDEIQEERNKELAKSQQLEQPEKKLTEKKAEGMGVKLADAVHKEEEEMIDSMDKKERQELHQWKLETEKLDHERKPDEFVPSENPFRNQFEYTANKVISGRVESTVINSRPTLATPEVFSDSESESESSESLSSTMQQECSVTKETVGYMAKPANGIADNVSPIKSISTRDALIRQDALGPETIRSVEPKLDRGNLATGADHCKDSAASGTIDKANTNQSAVRDEALLVSRRPGGKSYWNFSEPEDISQQPEPMTCRAVPQTPTPSSNSSGTHGQQKQHQQQQQQKQQKQQVQQQQQQQQQHKQQQQQEQQQRRQPLPQQPRNKKMLQDICAPPKHRLQSSESWIHPCQDEDEDEEFGEDRWDDKVRQETSQNQRSSNPNHTDSLKPNANAPPVPPAKPKVPEVCNRL